MKRKFEFIDGVVAIGMVATVLGGYAFFQVTDSGAVATHSSAYHMTNYPIKALVQAKLQPAMGQAIVDQALLEREFAAQMNRGARKLASAMRATEGRPNESLDHIEVWADQMEGEHKARVQYVMGRSIVRLTRQGMRSGALSADNLSNSVNDRIIEKAQNMGMKMQAAFLKNWQPRLGRRIVEAAMQERRYTGQVQERLGQATVDLASIEHAYRTKRAALQTQFMALIGAAARTKNQPDLFARAPMGNLNWQWALGIPSMPQDEVMEAGTIPQIPFTYIMVASIGLVTMLFFGWTWPRGSREVEVTVSRMEGRNREKYRKAV